MDELRDVLHRPKFANRLSIINKSVEDVLDEYLQFAEIVEPAQLMPVVENDPDDDAVLACALGGDAQFIITGDEHLLSIKQFRDISIMDANQFLNTLRSADE